jgi:hypothetical protein
MHLLLATVVNSTGLANMYSKSLIEAQLGMDEESMSCICEVCLSGRTCCWLLLLTALG